MSFVGLFGGGWLILMASSKRMHFKLTIPARKPKAPIEAWATWKTAKATLAKYRAAEHKDWQDTYDLLVQATCVHEYPGTSQSPRYYTCWKCNQEEPWEWREGCICHHETILTMDSPVEEKVCTHRHGNCKWHGNDYENLNKRSDRTNKPFKTGAEISYLRELELKRKYQL